MNNFKYNICFALTILFSLHCSSSANQSSESTKDIKNLPVLAISNATCRGVSMSVCDAVNESAVNAVKSGKTIFQIVDRNKIDKILQEHSMQQSGLTGSNRDVELGKFLNAEFILSLNISRISKMSLVDDEEDFSVSTSIINVENSRTISSSTGIANGQIAITKEAYKQVIRCIEHYYKNKLKDEEN